nr:odorant receptor 43 [Papilio dardanus]
MKVTKSGELKQCFDLFKKCFIYFFVNNNSKIKYWKLCCLVPFVIIHNATILSFLSKIFNEEVNAFEVAYMIPVYLVSLQAILKAATILSKKSDIEALINDLSLQRENSDLTDKQIKKKKSLTKRLKIYLAMFYWSNILGTWLHFLAPLTSVLFRRFILKQNCELVLPFGSVYPYEPSDSWFKYLGTYAFQVYTMSCEVYAYVASEFLMIVLCATIAIEFSILREDLLHVAPHFATDNPRNQMAIGLETNSESNTSSIQDFIQRHQTLIRLAKKLDDIFNEIIFINLLFVTATLCFFGFATTVARGVIETMNNLVAVLALLLPTYIFCYYGELLKDESSGIAESAYINEWYKGDMRYQKMIHFIIARRSQRPCCLTSLRHVPVTMTMFTKVLSTTWSYFSLATSIYSRGK